MDVSGKGRKYRVSSTESANEIKSERVDMSGLAKRPLKILCLHGYRQNDITFREKLGAFRKMVGKYCEFTFVTAPHPVLPMGHEDINQVCDRPHYFVLIKCRKPILRN